MLRSDYVQKVISEICRECVQTSHYQSMCKAIIDENYTMQRHYLEVFRDMVYLKLENYELSEWERGVVYEEAQYEVCKILY